MGGHLAGRSRENVPALEIRGEEASPYRPFEVFSFFAVRRLIELACRLPQSRERVEDFVVM